MSTQTQQCRKCKETKSVDLFYKKSGSAGYRQDCKSCYSKMAKERRKRQKEQGVSKEWSIYELDKNIYDWQLGKYAGNIYTENDKTYSVSFYINGNNIRKSFTYEKYKESAEQEAKKYQIEISNKYNLTKNKIRILSDDKTIEVKLREDLSMYTDIKYLDVVQKYTIGPSFKGNKFMTKIKVEGKDYIFANYITRFKRVKYANGNCLDCRIENILDNSDGKYVTDSMSKANTSGYRGVRKCTSEKYWVAHLYANGKSYYKRFSINKNGEEEAKMMAIGARHEMEIKHRFVEINYEVSPIPDPKIIEC